MDTIPYDEVLPGTSTTLDDTMLFSWQDEIYRGISAEGADFHRTLLARSDFRPLLGTLIVGAEITDHRIRDYDLVLKHTRIPVVSYCSEWIAPMLRDAALLTASLGEQLFKRKLHLLDAHPWNVLFQGVKPIFVDWGSIRPFTDQSWPYHELRSYFIGPLLLMAGGHSSLARQMMRDPRNALPWRDVLRLLVGRINSKSLARIILMDRSVRKLSYCPSERFFKLLTEFIGMVPDAIPTTEWTDYGASYREMPFDQPDRWPKKMRNVDMVFSRLRPESVLEFGCNKGWFSELAVRHGATVVATDIDEPSLCQLYSQAKAQSLPVLPLYFDFCFSTPAHGLVGAYPKASKRFRADLVTLLAVTHHLVFKNGLSFEAIAEQLALFTERSALVEFVPAEDEHVKKWMSPRFSWYHLAGFKRALGKVFSSIEEIESSPSPRVLLLVGK